MKTFFAFLFALNCVSATLSGMHFFTAERRASKQPPNFHTIWGVSYPRNLEQLQRTVRLARKHGYKVCLAGAGMSQNGQNVGGAFFVRVKLDKMNAVAIDAGARTAVVTGNVLFSELEDRANEYALAVKVRQASPIFGVLSSISTNVHGWDHRSGCLGETVNWVEVIEDDGESRVIARDDPEFRECVGAFGFKYIIWRAELQLTPNITLRKQMTRFARLPDAIAYFHAIEKRTEMILIGVESDAFAVFAYFAVSDVARRSENLQREPENGPYAERLFLDVARFLLVAKMRPLLERLYAFLLRRTWRNDETALRNELMNISVNALKKRELPVLKPRAMRIVEYFVEERHLESLVALYRRLYAETFVFNASIRFVPRYNASITSYAQTDVFALVVCWDESLGARTRERSARRNGEFLDFLYARGGTFYLPYSNTAQNIRRFYPEFADWVRSEKSIISNAMIEGLKAIS